MKTIGSLPADYINNTNLVINDQEFGVVARNLIITLIGMLVTDPSEAVPCMLHLWYSAMLRRSDIDTISKFVLPLFEDVNHKVKNKPNGTILGKTWILTQNTYRVELTKERWSDLLKFVQENASISSEAAQHAREAVTLAPERIDRRDRAMFSQKLAHRMSVSMFWKDGLLLPFGAKRDSFVIPNPFVCPHKARCNL